MKVSRRVRNNIALLMMISAIAGLAAGWFTYTSERDRIMGEAFSLLALYHDLRKATLEDYMRSKASDVKATGRNERVIEALTKLELSWARIGGNASAFTRRLYITENPFPIGERRNLRSASDGSEYTDVHQQVHDWARRFLEHFGYYDLFLIDRHGNILYTVEKEDDFATNLADGPYANGPLGFVFKRALKSGASRVVFSDYEFYPPSNNAPALFAGTPVFGPDGKAAGVFAVQLPAEPINAILRFSAGMGRTGETYVVGNDLTMRSQSRFSDESTVLKTKVDTPSVVEGLGGFEGAQVIADYRGVPVLSSYSPLDFGGPPWVMLAEMDRAEVLERLRVWPAVIVGMLAMLLSALLGHIAFSFFQRS
ncbi:MAG: cache domain-containing protein [Hyphomicrobiaceae bacterium]|nr:cache domain-containing protein [Hyphomicrobiaceae bacterium]